VSPAVTTSFGVIMNPTPTDRDRMLLFVVSRAIAVYRGDKAPTAADRRLAAQLLCSPGAPLERFEARAFTQLNGGSKLIADL
jgi:hypothetical protein